MSVRVINADVRAGLARLPDESVHCVVTSPPYFGLRSYGTEPQVWGGEGCEHEWGEQGTSAQRIRNGAGGGLHDGRGDDKLADNIMLHPPTGAFCRHCNAWRGSLGLESQPALYIEHMVAVFREVRRVLRKDGTLWLNIGDSYASGGNGIGNGKQLTNVGSHLPPKKAPLGFKPKDLLGVPWMLAFALRDDGWYLRSEITWAKRAPMPESVTDRPTTATEKVFLLSRSPRYYFDTEAVKEESETNDPRRPYTSNGAKALDGRETWHSGERRNGDDFSKRNMRNWWLLGPEPFPEAHFATFPTEIPRRAILAGCPVGGTVLDPFLGAGTTALVADRLGRNCIGIELNPEYAAMAERRVRGDAPLFADVTTEDDMPPDWQEQDSLGSWRVAVDAIRKKSQPREREDEDAENKEELDEQPRFAR